jgi:hypothetical protein
MYKVYSPVPQKFEFVDFTRESTRWYGRERPIDDPIPKVYATKLSCPLRKPPSLGFYKKNSLN